VVRELSVGAEAPLTAAAMTDCPKPANSDARIDWHMDRSGLAALNQIHTIQQLSECLTRLHDQLRGEDQRTISFVHIAAAARLKAVGVQGATKLLKTALPKANPAASRSHATDVDPWTDVVNLAGLLHEIYIAIRRYVVLDEPEAVVVALWVVHTHCMDAAEYTPRLAILSPTKRCGKTTLLKVLARLVHRHVSAANISTAALFRVIERDHPTVLIDEADTFLPENEQMRGVLNAGHDRASGKVIRVDVGEGGRHELNEFDPWGAVAIALIGRLPVTLADRSITLRLKRKTNRDQVQRFRRPQAEALLPLARKCRRWNADHGDTLRRAPAVDIEQLDARAADNWEPLLAIAHAAGPEWTARAINAAEVLSKGARNRERRDDTGERLLGDIRVLVEEGRFCGRVSMRELARLLAKLDDAPWSTMFAGRANGTDILGHILRTFEIEPRSLRIGNAPVAKGYEQSAFESAFDRYLSQAAVTPVTSAEAHEEAGTAVWLQDSAVTEVDRAQKINGCSVVTAVTEGSPSIRHHPTNLGGAGA
jgi:putative DNA primase/helicase